MNEHNVAIVLAVFASSGFWAFLTNVFQKPELTKVLDELTKVNGRVESLQDCVDKSNAINSRMRILRFDDELYNEMKHSKEYFNQILDEIDRYESYCNGHPEFENNQAVAAINHIRTIHQKCWDEHSFL